MDVRVSGIHVYPVKSCGGFAVERSRLDACGLMHDRRFMIVSPLGAFLTQRELPALARIGTAIIGAELELACDGHTIRFPLRPLRGKPFDVVVWGDRVRARAMSPKIDAWLAARLGEAVGLVYIPDEVIRPVDPRYASGSRTGFADGFPLLLIGQASLDELNERLLEPVEMSRFRPNLVITGAAPYAEDGWRDVTIGAVPLRIVKPCARCAIITTDQRTGARSAEPLRTLAGYRRVGNDVMFGQNVNHLGEGEIAVGDPVMTRSEVQPC